MACVLFASMMLMISIAAGITKDIVIAIETTTASFCIASVVVWIYGWMKNRITPQFFRTRSILTIYTLFLSVIYFLIHPTAEPDIPLLLGMFFVVIYIGCFVCHFLGGEREEKTCRK